LVVGLLVANEKRLSNLAQGLLLGWPPSKAGTSRRSDFACLSAIPQKWINQSWKRNKKGTGTSSRLALCRDESYGALVPEIRACVGKGPKFPTRRKQEVSRRHDLVRELTHHTLQNTNRIGTSCLFSCVHFYTFMVVMHSIVRARHPTPFQYQISHLSGGLGYAQGIRRTP
jgi:hypothetical protein